MEYDAIYFFYSYGIEVRELEGIVNDKFPTSFSWCLGRINSQSLRVALVTHHGWGTEFRNLFRVQWIVCCWKYVSVSRRSLAGVQGNAGCKDPADTEMLPVCRRYLPEEEDASKKLRKNSFLLSSWCYLLPYATPVAGHMFFSIASMKRPYLKIRVPGCESPFCFSNVGWCPDVPEAGVKAMLFCCHLGARHSALIRHVHCSHTALAPWVATGATGTQLGGLRSPSVGGPLHVALQCGRPATSRWCTGDSSPRANLQRRSLAPTQNATICCEVQVLII